MEKRRFACMEGLAIAVVAATGLATIGCGGANDASTAHAITDAGSFRAGGAPARLDPSGALGEGVARPKGTQLVNLDNVQIDGLTTDGYAVYTDENEGSVYVVSLAGGKPFLLGPVDESNHVFVKGRTVVFAPASTNLGVTDLWVWRSPFLGAVPLSGGAAAFSSLVAVSDDGESILFFDDVDPEAIANLVIARVDGTERTTLVTRVQLSNGDCTPTVAFAGVYAIAGYCIAPPPAEGTLDVPFHAGKSDGGSFDPGYPDAGVDAGTPSGYQAPIATVSTFSGPGWSQRTIATGVSSQFTVDAKGTELIVGGGSDGLLWFPLDGESGGTVIDALGTHGTFVNDGGAIVYTTSANDLARSPVVSPSPTPLSSGIARVIATSSDENWVIGFLGLDLDTYTVDLYYASATSSGPATPLVSTREGTTGGAYGDSFTADSSHAIFFTDIGEETATLYVAPLGASAQPASLVAPNVYSAYATTGAKILFNEDYDPDTNRADIAWVDATRPGVATTLVSQADAVIYLTPTKGEIVYSWNADESGAGIWIMDAP